MKSILNLSTLLLITLFVGSAQASPVYPWDDPTCSQIRQNDHVHIGTLCSQYDGGLGVTVVNVYYLLNSYLGSREQDYVLFYVNLSLNGSFHARRGLRKEEFGDGTNLPKKMAFIATYTASTNFEEYKNFPEGKPFSIYFEAEQKNPTTNPPITKDDSFGNNYHGIIPARRN